MYLQSREGKNRIVRPFRNVGTVKKFEKFKKKVKKVKKKVQRIQNYFEQFRFRHYGIVSNMFVERCQQDM